MKKKLPIGKQAFKELIEADCIYVDKTEHIYRLVTEYSFILILTGIVFLI